jgi:ATP-binding cassette subfamily B protein
MKVSIMMSWLMPIITIIMSGSMIAVMYIGGQDVISNIDSFIAQGENYEGLKVGDIMASTTYIFMIINGFMMLAMMLQFMIRGLASVKRINEVLNTKPVITSGSVKEGEEVEKGQTIGTIGESASFEVAEDAHLHFELYKDGEALNPTIYLK